MIAVHPEFIVDEKTKKKTVIVSFNEWQRLMEEIEELEDIRAYDKAKERSSDMKPFEDVVRQIKAETKK